MKHKKNIIIYLLLFTVLSSCSQTDSTKGGKIDTLEFQTNYPFSKYDALEQLKKYPSARYLPNNNFVRIYNWMNPYYAAGGGEKGIKTQDVIKKACDIQEELAMNWNYNFLISLPRVGPSEKSLTDANSPTTAFIALANKHPEIPLGVTIFWGQMAPSAFGNKNKQPNVWRADYPESFLLKDARINKTRRVISYTAPDSLFIADGQVQKKQLELLVKHLTRPITIINENGEEPPKAYEPSILKNDSALIYDKNKMQIDSWKIYAATKKKYIRNLYSSQFLNTIPELKNTWFSFYQVEGGPIDRYDWHTSKATNTKINGNYYSTPDLYPRTPDNWKTWNGAWHGWKWINDGRKIEIADGDRFFSPFIAAGWAYNYEQDIRPGQWLGMLKCLTVIGAEFFYTGYFNENRPYTKPENYIWQIAIPSYAQAIATHFKDIFRNGNVLFDSRNKPIVTYPCDEKDVLVTVRKHDKKQQYIIAATVQKLSNKGNFPLNKNIEIKIDDETFIINARRQGSVYFLDKTAKPYIFYQLDKWHQYEHPDRWRKELIYEAEVFDTANSNIDIKTNYINTDTKIDFTSFESFVSLNKNQWLGYTINKRDIEHLGEIIYLFIYQKSVTSAEGEIKINTWNKKITITKSEKWNCLKVEIPKNSLTTNNFSLLKIMSFSSDFEIDKIVISDSDKEPSLLNY